jgi:hypothetical protein
VQGGPEHFGLHVKVVVTGERLQRFAERAERVSQCGRRLRVGELQVHGVDEHGVVQRRAPLGEVDVGRRDRGQRCPRGGGLGPCRAHLGGDLGEALHRDRRHDGVLALEVAVEHRLAVFDQVGQPAGGHRVPALGLGEVPGGRDDQPLPLPALSLTTLPYRHALILAPLANLSL